MCAMVGIRSQNYPAIAHFILKETDMIAKKIELFCKNYQQIENYNEAVNDNSEVWDCHHRLELHDDYINTREELKLMGLYYDRPPEELIFLKRSEHSRLHNTHEKRRANFLTTAQKGTKEIKYPKMREARLRYYHGENWSEEDQKEFEKERNDRHTTNWRNRYRDKYNSYMKETQDRWRAEHPFYYRVEATEP